MNLEENTPEKDQAIRQKLADFCPDTAWTPANTWEKIAEKMPSTAPERKRIYLSFSSKKFLRIAAVFLLLISMGGVIWLQIADYQYLDNTKTATPEEIVSEQKSSHKAPQEKKPTEEEYTLDDKNTTKSKQTALTAILSTQKKQERTDKTNKNTQKPNTTRIVITQTPQIGTTLDTALDLPEISLPEATALTPTVSGTTVQQSPPIVLKVAESAKQKKFNVRVGKARNKSVQGNSALAENSTKSNSPLRVRIQDNKSEIKPLETRAEVALLKVTLK